MADLIQILEKAYCLDVATESEWLEGVTRAVGTALGFSSGAVACSYEVRADGWVNLRAVCDVGTPSGFAASLLSVPTEGQDRRSFGDGFRRILGMRPIRGELRRALSCEAFEAFDRQVFEAYDIRDMFVLNAPEAVPAGCFIAHLSRDELPETARSRWTRIAAHIAAGHRLQRRLLAMAPPSETPEAEAVLTPTGRVDHAVGAAVESSARDRLRAAVVAADRARGSLRRREPDAALEIWKGLVAGRWSLVDQFERDGRRFVVALRNAPAVTDPRILTERERQVVGYAGLGHSNKLIAYELGLSTSTVSVLLSRARKKLAHPQDE